MENNLREIRRSNKITQEQLAEKVGVTKYHINRIERGKNIPSVAISVKIAVVLNVKVEDIFLN